MLAARKPRQSLRVVSLLPSATENFCALIDFVKSKHHPRSNDGASDATVAGSSSSDSSRAWSDAVDTLPELVGRSHECDFPAIPQVQQLPVLTRPRTTFTTSADIHQQVQTTLADVSSLYHLDASRLVALRPDLILTQSKCKVCSIDYNSISNAVHASEPIETHSTTLDNASHALNDVDFCQLQIHQQQTQQQQQAHNNAPPRSMEIVTLNPTSLHQVLVEQFQQLGQVLGLEAEAESFIQEVHLTKLRELEQRAARYQQTRQQQQLPKPRVLFVEWLDPLFLGTHGWMRELVEIAGGEVIESFDAISAATQQVDFVVVALCGLSLEKTISELDLGNAGEWWKLLFDDRTRPSAFSDIPVLVVNGTAMFTRPTGRLLVALEWLIEALGQQEPSSATFSFAERYDPQRFGSTRSDDAKEYTLQDIEEAHRAACLNHQDSYKDPATGFSVWTEYYLRTRQTCCGNGCRHCPYGHANVKTDALRKNILREMAFLAPFPNDTNKLATHVGGKLLWPSPTAFPARVEDKNQLELTVVFWSGGKDSLLALSELFAAAAAGASSSSSSSDHTAIPQVVLLTTIDPVTNRVPIQNVSISTIVAQAKELELPLCLAPVAIGDAQYVQKACAALDLIQESFPDHDIQSLVFGDLHLQDIRAWREKYFGSIASRPHLQLRFPLFDRDMQHDLAPKLQRLCRDRDIEIVFAAMESKLFVQHTGLKRGDVFDVDRVMKLVEGASEELDFMGEKGEFHTCVLFPKLRQEINRDKGNF